MTEHGYDTFGPQYPEWYDHEDLASCIRCESEHPEDEMRDCPDCGEKVCHRCWGAAIDAHLDCPEVLPAVNAVRRIQEANEGSSDSLIFQTIFPDSQKQ